VHNEQLRRHFLKQLRRFWVMRHEQLEFVVAQAQFSQQGFEHAYPLILGELGSQGMSLMHLSHGFSYPLGKRGDHIVMRGAVRV